VDLFLYLEMEKCFIPDLVRYVEYDCLLRNWKKRENIKMEI